MNKQITTLLGVGLAVVVAFMIFKPKKATTSSTTSAEDGDDDSEGFMNIFGRRKKKKAQAQTNASSQNINAESTKPIYYGEPIAIDPLDKEASEVESIGIKKAKVKQVSTGSLKKRIVDAVVSELGVNPKEAIMLIRNRDERVLPILYEFSKDLKKKGRVKRGLSTAMGMQTSEESQFAFNSMDEID